MPRSQRLPMILVALATAALLAVVAVIVMLPGATDREPSTHGGTAAAPGSGVGPDVAAGGSAEGDPIVEGDGPNEAPAGERSAAEAGDDSVGAVDPPAAEGAPAANGGAAPQLPRPNLRPRIPVISGPISIRIVETGNALLSDQPGCGVTGTRVVVEIDQQPRSQPYRWDLVAAAAGQYLGQVGVQAYPTQERLLLTFGSVAGLRAGPISASFTITDATGQTAAVNLAGFRIAGPGCS